MRLKTWHLEHAAVVAVLLGVWLATGHKPRELAGSLAVYLSFGHASVGERLREREAARAVPSVECHRTATWYFVGKELVWAGYFIWSGTYAALVGCAVFALYPLWRRWWRRVHPMTPAAEPCDRSADSAADTGHRTGPMPAERGHLTRAHPSLDGLPAGRRPAP